MLAGKVYSLCDLGFGDFERIDPANTDATLMDMKHDLCRFFAILVEESFQDVNDEFHWRVIVIQQQHFVERRFFGLRPRSCHDPGNRIARPRSAAVFAHPNLCALRPTQSTHPAYVSDRSTLTAGNPSMKGRLDAGHEKGRAKRTPGLIHCV